MTLGDDKRTGGVTTKNVWLSNYVIVKYTENWNHVKNEDRTYLASQQLLSVFSLLLRIFGPLPASPCTLPGRLQFRFSIIDFLFRCFWNLAVSYWGVVILWRCQRFRTLITTFCPTNDLLSHCNQMESPSESSLNLSCALIGILLWVLVSVTLAYLALFRENARIM